MANRDLTNFRTVINQVPDLSGIEQPTGEAPSAGNQLLNVGVQIADKILKENQEARITEGISNAQMELQALEFDYQAQFAHDPAAGLGEYKANRQAIFDKYGENVSVLYKRQWNDSTRKIAELNDATGQAWMLKQTKVNTTNSVNSSILNNMKMAMSDGQAFGNSDSKEIDAFVNYASSAEELEKFATQNLGQQQAEALFANYDEDYMKSFLSGVSQTNPAKAFQLMQSDMVKEHFSDTQQYDKMFNAMQVRNNKFEVAQRRTAKLNQISATDDFADKVVGGKLGYAEMQQFISENDVDPVIARFFEETAGFAERRKAVKGVEKLDQKTKFTALLSETLKKESIPIAELQVLQQSVYNGMSKDVLTAAEGYGYINQLLRPITQQKQNQISELGEDDGLFSSGFGLKDLDEAIADTTGLFKQPENKRSALEKLEHEKTTNAMYDLYLEGLASISGEQGLSIGDLNTLSKKDRRVIFNDALSYAKSNYTRSLFPSLANVPDSEMPKASITSDGKKITPNLTSGKPSAKVVAPKTMTATDKNGNKALVEVDDAGNIIKVIRAVK